MPISRRQKGRNAQRIGTHSPVSRPGSGASSYSSASPGRKGETIDFQKVKEAALAAKTAFFSSKQKTFITYVGQLENDIKHGDHTTYQKIPDRIRMITFYVTSNQQNEDAKPFMDCMKKFSRCLKRGIEEMEPLKYIKRVDDSTEIRGQSQSAPIEQRPESCKDRQSSSISEIRRRLKETQSRLEKRFKLLQGEHIPTGFLNDTMTDIDLLENIEKLAESFAEAAEKAAKGIDIMKQFQEEVGRLIAEVQDSTPIMKWPKQVDGEQILSVREARKAVSEEKQLIARQRNEISEIEQEINYLHAAVENSEAYMAQGKPPKGQLACQIWIVHKKTVQKIHKLKSTVYKLEQEIELLREDIENLDNINYSKQIKSETKLPNGLRTLLASKKEKLLHLAEYKEKAAEDSVRGITALEDKIQALWKSLPEEQRSTKDYSVLFKQLEDIDAALGSRDKQIKQLNSIVTQWNEEIKQLQVDIGKLDSREYKPNTKDMRKDSKLKELREQLDVKKNRILSTGSKTAVREEVKLVADNCTAMLEEACGILSKTFGFKAQSVNKKMLTKGIQEELHGLLIIVHQVCDCVDYSKQRQFVDSSLVFQTLHKMYANITGQSYTQTQKPRSREQKPVKDAQEDLIAEIEEICEAVIERKHTEMNRFCDEVDRLVKEIYYPKPQMQWSKEPDREPAKSVREARIAIAEEKKLTERRNKAKDHLRQEIQLLNEDIENLDNENYTPQLKLTNADTEHLKELEFLRKRLATRKKELLSSRKDRDDGNMSVPGRLATFDHTSEMSKTRFDDDMYVSGRHGPKS